MQNNLEAVRVALQKAESDRNSKQGLACGFEYASNIDGVVLPEQRWRDLRRKSHTCFRLYTEDPHGSRSNLRQATGRVSLEKISNQVDHASRQYQRNRALPTPAPRPHAIPAPVSAMITGAPTCKFQSAEDELRSLGDGPVLATFDASQKTANNRNNNNNNNHHPVSTLTFPSKTENYMQPPPARSSGSIKIDFGADHASDDDFDALIASVDVEEIVSRSSTGGGTFPSSNSSNNNNNNNISSHAKSQRFSSNFDYGDSWERNNGTTRSSFASVGSMILDSSFDNSGRNSDSSFSRSSSMKNSYLSEPLDNSADGSSSVSGGQNSFGSRVISDSGEGRSSSGSFGGFVRANHCLHPDKDPGNAQNGCSMLCPGHNLPCLVLTANTAANAGRQFFKCSMPDDQKCDFFQWVDGIDGNLYNNIGETGDAPYDSTNVKDLVAENRRVFGHRTFRPGQKEIIQRAIEGQDIFVLMPTGGGKSLCYQLPAWCCPGLAVVISPLLSLIQDQVQSLVKLGIDAVFLTSTQDYQTEQMDIVRRLNEVSAHDGVKMLYITPEKLTNSNQMQSLIRRLADRKLISRFVIDEAHCLSDWGHDFRVDYMRLDMLRRDFPHVPLMALTATANEKVVNDAIRLLGMRNEYRYKSSFNRPNLHYEVRKKDAKSIDAIAEYISKRPHESGVVYCLSRKDCEKLADQLQEKVRQYPGCSRVRVDYYHAEVDAHERERRHREWSNGRVGVICATIAFGMGIDKPDVRYVIHYSMPKSITHYYQESGRAGRDGDQADCILYYQYKDKNILENLIIKGANNPNNPAVRRQIDQLYTCVRYCEDLFRCRRTMQLEFFGERFDRSGCGGTCDNCRTGRVPDSRDMTQQARELLHLLSDLQKQKKNGVTLSQLSELYRGTKSKSATKFINLSQLKDYGAGKHYKKHEVDRIVHALIFERILVESGVQNNQGFSSDYVSMGENATMIQSGGKRFIVEFPQETPKSDACGKDNHNQARNKNAKVAAATATATATTRTPASRKKARPQAAVEAEILEVEDTDMSSPDGDLLSLARPSLSKLSISGSTKLPEKETKELLAQIRKLVSNWADEERMMGNTTFYWNILSNDAMKAIASQTPMNLDDLKDIGTLGENIIKEYGDRLVRVVQNFVNQNNLQQYVRPVKRAKTATRSSDSDCSSGVPVVASETKSATRKKPARLFIHDDDNDKDEFGDDIDFSRIPMPDSSQPNQPSVIELLDSSSTAGASSAGMFSRFFAG